MTDKPNLEFRETWQTDAKNLYSYEGNFSSKDLNRIMGFMHENFPHLSYGGTRDKGITVGFPPPEICTVEKWQEIMDKVLVPELDSLDPIILRRNKIIIKFVDDLIDYRKGVTAGANAMAVVTDEGSEVWIRVNHGRHGRYVNAALCAFRIMHELTELDFWSKTSKEEKKELSKAEHKARITDLDSFAYLNLLDEKIANRRAMRAIKRMWPKAGFVNPEDEYEEDREPKLET